MVKIALIGLLGIGAQWVAWRINKPAIALMLAAGILAGPVFGIINPARDFGALLEPVVKLAVAVILFEGGLQLNFRDLRQAGWPVLRLVVFGVPIGWVLGTAAGHYGAGLPLSVAALFGGILVVTGPTVIGPMLRTLRVGNRVGNILKWEGIVNDPIGALFAVAIYAYVAHSGDQANIYSLGFDVLGATFIAGLIGAALGFAMVWIFPRGLVPEYLKAPILLVTVILGFVVADIVMHETGLITVTIMGIVMGNKHIYSSRALHRFKEDLAVLLISGVFILLSATLEWETIQMFEPRYILFLALILFVVRPITVLVSLAFSKVPFREQLFIAWIAPRGIVAIAVTSLFALRLVDIGYEGAEALVPLVFSVVIVTIVAHGFSAGWVARRLGIDQGKGENLLLLGANRWTIGLGRLFKDMDFDVTISDPSKFALRDAKRAEINTHQGDLLDESHDDIVDIGQYQHMLIVTGNDSYNKLIATDLGPEVGYEQISMVAADSGESERGSKRGRILLQSGADYATLVDRARDGWVFSKTRLTEKFTWDDFKANLEEGEEAVAVVKPDRRVLFFATAARPVIEDGDTIISFVAPETPEERKAVHREKKAEKAEKVEKAEKNGKAQKNDGNPNPAGVSTQPEPKKGDS